MHEEHEEQTDTTANEHTHEYTDPDARREATLLQPQPPHRHHPALPVETPQRTNHTEPKDAEKDCDDEEDYERGANGLW